MTVVLKDAQVFAAGYDLSGQMNQVAVDKEAESLDVTVFGNSTRVRRGGLKSGRITGSGFLQQGVGEVDPVLFDNVAISDVVVVALPETITEGSTSTGSGYMTKAEVLRLQLGGAVGDVAPFSFEAVGRGV